MADLVQDPALGPFAWDEELRYWRGQIDLPSGRSADLDVSPATDAHAADPAAAGVFAAAGPVAAWLRDNERASYLAVSRDMVGVYNAHWSDEPPITAEEFADRIELVGVGVPSDGRGFTLWFTDGEMEMFGSHGIQAWFDAGGQLRGTSL